MSSRIGGRLVAGLVTVMFGICVAVGLASYSILLLLSPWGVQIVVPVAIAFGYVITRLARRSRMRE